MSANRRMTVFTRLGFAARGLLYIAIAMLVLQSGRSEDPSGALVELGKRGGGLLLLAMAAGFVAYGVWRLADAALNLEGHEAGSRGAGGRLAAAGSGAVYLTIAWQALRLAGGGHGGAGDRAEESARTALSLPGGPLLLQLSGAAFIGAGVYQLVKAYRCSFCDRLDPAVANRASVRWTGRAGYAARGLIFMITGFFLASAGLDSQASEAGGMEDALRWLASPVDLAVAAGLLLFGLFSLVEARFRIIHDVPLDQIADAVHPGRFARR